MGRSTLSSRISLSFNRRRQYISATLKDIFGNAENRTQVCRLRSKNAISVLSSPFSRYHLCFSHRWRLAGARARCLRHHVHRVLRLLRGPHQDHLSAQNFEKYEFLSNCPKADLEIEFAGRLDTDKTKHQSSEENFSPMAPVPCKIFLT